MLNAEDTSPILPKSVYIRANPLPHLAKAYYRLALVNPKEDIYFVGKPEIELSFR